jgi:hypothetical protein
VDLARHREPRERLHRALLLSRSRHAERVCGDGRRDGVSAAGITQVAARWNNPAAYDPTFDVAPPFGSPIDIQDIIAIAEQWDSACQ